MVDSKAQQDNSNIQIQSPGTETGQHRGEAIRENDLGWCRCAKSWCDLDLTLQSDIEL